MATKPDNYLPKTGNTTSGGSARQKIGHYVEDETYVKKTTDRTHFPSEPDMGGLPSGRDVGYYIKKEH